MFHLITDMKTAEKAAKQGVFACAFIAIVTMVMTLISMNVTPIYDVDYFAFVDVVLIIIIGFFINKMSRIAAVLGLIVYVLEQINMMVSNGAKPSILMIIFIGIFINSIRGTFAYHKYKKEQRA